MLLTLQQRLKTLIEADDYFEGVPVLTEDVANLEAAVDQALAGLGFVVIIQCAEGEATKPDSPAPIFNERLVVTIAQPPTISDSRDPETPVKNVVTGAERAMLAIKGSAVTSGLPDNRRFGILSHRTWRLDNGIAMQEITVAATAALTSA